MTPRDAYEFLALSKAYGPQAALVDLSITIQAGSVVGLVGPNGAGKTTLLSILAGLIPTHGGAFRFPTREETESPPVGYAPQDPEFPPWATPIQVLDFLARAQGIPDTLRAKEIRRTLEAVELWKERDKKCKALSHGMKKRLCIAQGFLGTPSLLLLDEPTAGLDPLQAKRIRNAILARSPAQTVLISSHNLSEVENICTHVLILEQGNLRFFGSLAAYTKDGELLHLKFSSPVTEATANRLKTLEGIKVLKIDSASGQVTFQVQAGSLDNAMTRVLQSCNDWGLTVLQMQRGARLEEEFSRNSTPSEG